MIRYHNDIPQEKLVDVLLSLDEEHCGYVLCQRARNTFDVLVDMLQSRNIQGRPDRAQIALINRLLFYKWQFAYAREPRPEVITLAQTLHKKRGACLGLTALYYALADAVNLAIRPLLYEGHVAICHIRANPPQHIEVSRRGALLPRKLVTRLYAQKRRPVVLAKEEFIGVYLSNRAAFVLVPQGQPHNALRSLDVAVELSPNYGGAWVNRAAILLMLGNRRGAQQAIEHAFDLGVNGRFSDTARMLYETIRHKPSRPPAM